MTDAALRPAAVFSIEEAQLPEDALPAPATLLWPVDRRPSRRRMGL